MKNTELALFGGPSALPEPLPPYRSIGEAEAAAVAKVMESGCLSGFIGSPGPEFYGGPEIQKFEAAWCERYGVRHAITVNANTTGLVASMGAIGISPGDEIIVPPYSMSATAMAPLFYGGIPVFVDIEQDTFALDPEKVRAAITPRTRAILVVNLFGHPARLGELRRIADENDIYLVEDNAQTPRARENQSWAGTVGHIGVFSLNYHKHLHTGEGGVCVTDDDEIAERLALIRNHGENLVAEMKINDVTNLVGLNLRMTELSAAVGLVQLSDLERHVAAREKPCEALSDGVRDLEGLTPPVVRDGCRHNYYCWAMRYDEKVLDLDRETFCRALSAEGFPNRAGYAPPLYELPVFQRRVAIGRDGFPFNLTERRYESGMCPVVERIEGRELILFLPCPYDLDDACAEALIGAVRKVHAGIPRLRGLAGRQRPSEAREG